MRVPIISTAGAAGHGKTALVRALRGLALEPAGGAARATQAPVELGFAFDELAGRRHGLVDLPGSERLVRGLLSDVHGFDVVLLAVAADHGVRPQTEECIDLLHLLGARCVLPVITRADLADPARVVAVRAALEGLLATTSFADAPLHVVSSATGEGIAALRDEIVRRTAEPPPGPGSGPFRMYVDRSFFVAGRGLTVVGTVLSGTVQARDALALRPGRTTAEARALQVHGETVSAAAAGARLAVQLAGIERKVVRRGVVLAAASVEFHGDRVDCRIEVRPGARAPLSSFDRVEIDVGTVETAGSVVVLDGERIAPGSSGLCQIALERELIVAHGDRFVLRPEGAGRTTAGGTVLHPFAVRRKPGDAATLARLTRLEDPAFAPRLLAFLELLPELAVPVGYLAQGLDRSAAEVRRTAAGIPELVALPAASAPDAYATRDRWEALGVAVVEVLRRFARAHEDEPGMAAEALRSRLRVPVPPLLLDAVVERLVAEGTVARVGDLLQLPERRAAARERAPCTRPVRAADDPARAVRDALAAAGMTPPDLRSLASELAVPEPQLERVLAALERERAVVGIAPGLFFDAAAFARARELLVEFVASSGAITVADYRTLLSSSRKYALALLEHFDRTGVTVRTGDVRRLRGRDG